MGNMKEFKKQGTSYCSDRLFWKLSQIVSAKSSIIEAPSGYGKTTVMRAFLKDMELFGEDRDVFWFTAVDEAPSALYNRLCREIGKIDYKAGDRLREVGFPNAFTIGEACDAISSIECKREAWLIIDNFHILHPILAASFLDALLNHNCERLHIIFVTQMLGQSFRDALGGHVTPSISASDLKWAAEDILNYFRLEGEDITIDSAREVERLTSGWAIAVHLQLFSYRQSGEFSDEAAIKLMEHLVWEKMTNRQQDFLMRVSVFESCSAKQLCSILSSKTMPDFAAESLSIPFIRYVAEQELFVPHPVLLDMVCMKRSAQGEAFENECFVKAGEICKEEGEIGQAVYFFSKIKDYRRILLLDLSHIVCAEIGDCSFNDIALEIARNCPYEIRREFPISMLCIAWAVRILGEEKEFYKLMSELDELLPETGQLRAEWMLLSVYLSYPRLDEMLIAVKKAALLFEDAHSKVILPHSPWAFYEYQQLNAFHIRIGAADDEGLLLEEFIKVYSRLTNGHGLGADALYKAELSFFRCETADSEVLAYKAVFLSESKKQKTIQIGSARLLATIALLKADADGWQRAISAVEYAACGSVQNTTIFRTMLDVVRGSLLAQVRDYERMADIMKNTHFLSLQLPDSIHQKAVEMHGYYLMGRSEYARMVGFLQTVTLEKYTPFSEHFYHSAMAVGYLSLGEVDKAKACLKAAAEMALPDGLLHSFVGFSRLLHGLSDEFIKSDYPELLERFKEYKERYFMGWSMLHNAVVGSEFTALTEREREIAELAAEGLRNTEIAGILYLSKHTVRAHLRSIYQKLEIDRRASLAGKLK